MERAACRAAAGSAFADGIGRQQQRQRLGAQRQLASRRGSAPRAVQVLSARPVASWVPPINVDLFEEFENMTALEAERPQRYRARKRLEKLRDVPDVHLHLLMSDLGSTVGR